MLISVFQKKVRPAWIWLCILMLMNLIFMSFFITPDTRYVLATIPLLFIAIGSFFTILFRQIFYQFPHSPGYLIIGTLTFLLFASYLFIPNFGYRAGEKELFTLKKQISLNFRYQETPWHYLAAQHWTQVSLALQKDSKNIYVGTVLPAYYLELVSPSNRAYNTLPLVTTQEFFDEPAIQEDILHHESLLDRYQELIMEGNVVLVSPYYLSNLHEWEAAYAQFTTNFTLTKISNGCLDSCALYQLSAKK
jgi:hypothetical protein